MEAAVDDVGEVALERAAGFSWCLLKRDYAHATRTAAAISRVLAQLLITFGLVLAFLTADFGGVWIAVIGWFLLLAARAEAQAATIHLALAGLRVRDVMVAAPVTVEAKLPLERFLADVFPAHRYAAYPVLHRGSPVGLITSRDAARLPRTARTDFVVGDRMTALDNVPVVKPDDALEEAFLAIAASPLEHALVLHQAGLAGLLSATDVLGLIDARGNRAAPGAADTPAPRIAA